MKPTSISAIEHRLTRHDGRSESRRNFPATDYFFRPQTGAPLGRVPRRPSDRSRRAYRRMAAEMQSKYERDEPVELLLFGLVTALAAWPLVDLLVVMAHTANG
jgi:hypothetical protein